jgi:hypothetical protein
MATTVLQIPYPRWAATLNIAEYEDNWRTIERWANLARCPTAVPDWSQVSFRTPHPRWTTWQDAEENYLEIQRFASALAHLSTTHTCPSLQVPYKQWAREGLGAWSPAEESENLLAIQRWANAMPQCCGCIAPFIGSWNVLAGSTTLEVSGDHLTPIVDAYYIFQGEVLHRQPTTTTIIDPNPLATIIDFEYPGFELTATGDFYLVTACGTDTFHIINN